MSRERQIARALCAQRAGSIGQRPSRLVGAERVGFEPTDHLSMVNALAGRPIRPLWHLSWAGEVYRKPSPRPPAGGRCISSLSRGTVAEWTNAAALKAAGRKARGFESLPFRQSDLGSAAGPGRPRRSSATPALHRVPRRPALTRRAALVLVERVRRA